MNVHHRKEQARKNRGMFCLTKTNVSAVGDGHILKLS